MVDKVMTLSIGTRIMVLAPIVRERKGEHLHVFDELKLADLSVHELTAFRN